MRIKYGLDQEFDCNDDDQIRGFSCFSDDSDFQFSHCCARTAPDSDGDSNVLIIILSVIGGVIILALLGLAAKFLIGKNLKDDSQSKDGLNSDEAENLAQ